MSKNQVHEIGSLLPEEKFVILYSTRAEFADLLNSVIEDNELDVEPFKPKDARLTFQFCNEIADSLSELYEGDLDEEDFVSERNEILIEKLNSIR